MFQQVVEAGSGRCSHAPTGRCVFRVVSVLAKVTSWQCRFSGWRKFGRTIAHGAGRHGWRTISNSWSGKRSSWCRFVILRRSTSSRQSSRLAWITFRSTSPNAAPEEVGRGELGAKGDVPSFKQACRSSPTDENRRRILSALAETHFSAIRATTEFVSIADGLSIMRTLVSFSFS